MKVEFTLEEVQAMLDAVVTPLSELKGLSKSDKAALRRWRQDGMRGTSPDMGQDSRAVLSAELLSHVKGHFLEGPIFMALFLAFRRGETCGDLVER